MPLSMHPDDSAAGIHDKPHVLFCDVALHYFAQRSIEPGGQPRRRHALAASAVTRRKKPSTRSDFSSARVAADITSSAPSPSSGT